MSSIIWENDSMKSIWLLPLFFLITSCATHPHSEGRDEFIEQIEKHSAGDKQFSGVYEQFEFKATLLNERVSRLLHERLKLYYDWSQTESEQKLQERLSGIQDKTKLWLSFFTPDRKDDNLANTNTIWKIYLVANGQRYEGVVTKANLNYSEAQALFHYHNRWATPYQVEFPIPSRQIEGTSPQLIITGPLGRREVYFKR